MTTGVYPNPQWPVLSALLRWGRKSWWLSLVVWIMAIAPARAALELRVAIEEDVNRVTVGSSTPAVVKDLSGQVLTQLQGMQAITAEQREGRVVVDQWQSGPVWVEPSGDGYVYIGNRWYRGRALIVPESDGLTAVNYVDLEAYLYSVVGGEMPSSWNLEALKAQAVAARSYVLYRRNTGSNAVFDVGDTQTWQVYNGIEEEAPSTRAAVDATRGQVLTYNGQIIEAVFHSSSGGHTENVEDIWTSPLPYLRAVQDYDQGAPVYQWAETFTADAMRQRITGVGNIIGFEPVQLTPQGRVVRMRVIGDGGERVLTGSELRSALNLRSTLFTVAPSAIGPLASAGDSLPAPRSFRVDGRGFGHGLGMSQWGAAGLAQQGYNYAQILTHYYSNTRLAVIQVQ